MAKGKKQSADDLISRYAAETGSLAKAVAEPGEKTKPSDPLLESLRRNINRVVVVPLNLLEISENVRRTVDQDSAEFLSLVDSIRQNGVRQNIVLDLQESENEPFKLAVIAGQRRVLAARLAGITSIAALILQLRDRGQRLAEGLAENLFREDLHCLDQAEAYAALLNEGWSESQIAETFERRRKTILQFIRLARYPDKAKSYIREHKESFTAFVLFNKFIAKSWKSEAELLAKLAEVVEGKKTKAETRLSSTSDTQSRLIKAVHNFNGLKCKVVGRDEEGKITITYTNPAALMKLISMFEGVDQFE